MSSYSTAHTHQRRRKRVGRKKEREMKKKKKTTREQRLCVPPASVQPREERVAIRNDPFRG